jgi:hypothetical protein
MGGRRVEQRTRAPTCLMFTRSLAPPAGQRHPLFDVRPAQRPVILFIFTCFLTTSASNIFTHIRAPARNNLAFGPMSRCPVPPPRSRWRAWLRIHGLRSHRRSVGCDCIANHPASMNFSAIMIEQFNPCLKLRLQSCEPALSPAAAPFISRSPTPSTFHKRGIEL